jgi:methylated-DNA-[protein]-cysteine S-methyltransferase
MTEDRLAPPTFDPADAAAAAARFAATAPADVHYALVDSPIGTLVAAATARGLATLSYEDQHGGADAVLDLLAAKLSPRMLEAPARLDEVRRELDEYFAGRRDHFDLPIDWTLASPFGRRVLKATAAIPFGKVSTYGAMAAKAGNPKASRAAGRALGANPIPIVVPCHRVVGASGRLTGYTGGLHRKVALLEIEGVVLPS